MKIRYGRWLVVAASVLTLAACSGKDASPAEASGESPPPLKAGHQVNLVARGMQFEGPDTIPAGWTTFHFRNASDMTHFAVVEYLPPGVTRANYEAASAYYQKAMDLINQGAPDAGMAELQKLPAWTSHSYANGGVGLTGPGRASQATVYLKPGHYMVECYVKTNGVFHAFSSPSHPPMIHPLTVVAGESTGEPPHADVRVTVDQDKGLSLDAVPGPGRHTFAVDFVKQDMHVLGPDVHLFEVTGDDDIARANAWVDAMSPRGMETPAPIRFLGGTEELPTGKTGYFTATLQPGRYALISEVADPKKKGLLVTFTVPEADGNPGAER